MPKTTAVSPMIEPTDRSMPPVISTGVIAIAISPISTLNRVTSKKFATVRKRGAMTAKTSDRDRERGQRRPLAVWKPASHASAHVLRTAAAARGRSLRGPMCAPRVQADRGKNDRSLQRALPVGRHAHEGQCRPDGAEQHDTEHGAANRADATRHRGPADDDRSDDFHFESKTGIARHLAEARRVQHGRDCRQRSSKGERRPP